MEGNKLIYFTNEICQVIEDEMSLFRVDPFSRYENSGVPLEDVVFSIIKYLKKNKIDDWPCMGGEWTAEGDWEAHGGQWAYGGGVDKNVRNIIRCMDTMLDFSVEEEREKFKTLLRAIPKYSRCREMLNKEYENMLWKDHSLLSNRLEEERKFATERLKEDGFCPDTYIILKGAKTRFGYRVVYIENEKDIEKVLSADGKDTMIEISRSSKSPYLNVYVLKEGDYEYNYILIPSKKLGEAVEYPEVKKEYEKYTEWIQEDLKE